MAKQAATRRTRRAAQAALNGPIFAPRPYQIAAINDAARFQAWMWSRQTGKGFAIALKVNKAILEAEARGEAHDWMLLSRSLIATRQLARKVRGIGRAMCEAQKALAPEIDELRDNQLEITYPGGSRVLVLSSNPDAAVGFTGNVVIDEIDVHKQAQELLGNTFPVIATGGYVLILTSTPRGRRVMYGIYQDSLKAGSVWSFRKLTIHEAVAQGCDQDPELLRRGIRDELKWRQEFLCEFVDDEICWIPWEMLVACTSDAATMEIAPDCMGELYAGWDVSRWNHLSVFWVLEKQASLLVTRTVLVMQRQPFFQQMQQIENLARRFPKLRRICVDAGGMGEMPAEELARRLPGRVEPVKFTGGVKETLAGDVRRLMEERNLLLPDDDGVRDDFHSLRRSVTAAGNARFEGENGESHADRFWAAALAAHGAITPGGAIRNVSGITLDLRSRPLGGL